MSYELITADFETLQELEKKLLDGTIENRRDFWKKVTDINQKLSHATNLKDTDYEKFKEQLETIVNRIKEHQIERERYYTALREQITFNKTTFEKELAVISSHFNELQTSQSPELTTNNYFNHLQKFQQRLKSIRPFDKESRISLLEEINKIIEQVEVIRAANKEERFGSSDEFRATLFSNIEAQLNTLKEAIEQDLGQVYDRFFNEMEKLKSELSSDKMVKKHVDQAWKYWKNVKEEAKEFVGSIEKKNYDLIHQQIEELVAKLETITSPKEAFDNYKKIQNEAIKAPMKRRQKDKIFKRFKAIWALMQEKFESHYKEIEEKQAQREVERQKQAEQIAKKKESEAQSIEVEYHELEETVNRLKTEIKNSQSQTFIRKANEVLAINENRLYELKKRLDHLRRDFGNA